MGLALWNSSEFLSLVLSVHLIIHMQTLWLPQVHVGYMFPSLDLQHLSELTKYSIGKQYEAEEIAVLHLTSDTPLLVQHMDLCYSYLSHGRNCLGFCFIALHHFPFEYAFIFFSEILISCLVNDHGNKQMINTKSKFC